jgi:DNA-directed RNA polymerase subunit RPC12/RpoP
MSEFKYACPVCGQHIKCDSSQAGTVMECPTCFQKITVPQAPATPDQKFILTGTKVGERSAPKLPGDSASGNRRAKTSPLAAMVLVILVCAAGAAVFAFRGKIFKAIGMSGTNQTASAPDEDRTSRSNKTKPPKPALVAPPANDTNWMLNLADAEIPEARAVGRIHGRDFICERAFFENGALTLRMGTRGPINLGLTINFGGAQPESLSRQSVNVTTNADKAARVTLRWLGENQKIVRENFDSNYALRLNFNPLTGSRLSGKIYFCAPDDLKSYVMGSFNAEIRHPKPRPPH